MGDNRAPGLGCGTTAVDGPSRNVYAALTPLSDKPSLLHIARLVIRHQLAVRETANAASSRTRRLLDVIAALLDAPSALDVAAVVIQQGLEVLEASTGLVAVVDGDEIRALDWRLSPTETGDPRPTVSVSDDGPIGEALRRREPVWVESRERLGELFPRAKGRILSVTTANAILALPLLHGPDLLGVLALGFETTSAFGASDRRFPLLLAQSAGVALARAGAFERERDARRKAETIGHAREEVLGVVAHDLRNPLGVIGGAITLLRELELAPTERDKLLAAGARAVEQMKRLISDLLDVTRLETGRLVLDTEPVAVGSLLEEAAESVGAASAQRRIIFTVSRVAADLRVLGDRGRLAQVLANLLDNAIKFTPEGGLVTLRAWRDSGDVVFEVADTGPGLSSEDCAHLFVRFWQARASDLRGVGLGLAISKAIVEAHGGRIWVDSTVGVGSRVRFALPAAPDGTRARTRSPSTEASR